MKIIVYIRQNNCEKYISFLKMNGLMIIFIVCCAIGLAIAQGPGGMGGPPHPPHGMGGPPPPPGGMGGPGGGQGGMGGQAGGQMSGGFGGQGGGESDMNEGSRQRRSLGDDEPQTFFIEFAEKIHNDMQGLAGGARGRRSPQRRPKGPEDMGRKI
ncbi:protein pygopus-like [Microplitis mediator]|uniref:protein pygopus-like n=1 Tax=Microplitis mediator TaxID=375433 RepID=UPI002552D328|nr:protein pygopus-like [Microplitis mediator]